jgi:hypothetical protein
MREFKRVEQEKYLLEEKLGIIDKDGEKNSGGGISDLLKK